MSSYAPLRGRAVILLPLAAALIFQVGALTEAVRLSFFRSDMITSVFVGLENYRTIFTDAEFGKRFVNTLLYMLLLIPGWAGIPLLIALSIIGYSKGARAGILFTLYLPSFSAGIISSTVWRWVYATRGGLLNQVLGTQIQWMGDRYLAIVCISVILILSNLGLYTVIYTSALTAIPREVVEAARIDGASRGQIQRLIRVPMIAPVISLCVLLSMIAAAMVFETIYMMTPIVSAQNLMYDTYATAFVYGRYGLGAAKSVVLMIIVVALMLAKRRVEK